jgi:hypothetical protein
VSLYHLLELFLSENESFRHRLAKPRQPRKKNTPCISDLAGVKLLLKLDRIFTPENLANFQKLPINKIPNLTCPKCKSVLALPYIYKKEQRKAYRLFVGAVTKKITKI